MGVSPDGLAAASCFISSVARFILKKYIQIIAAAKATNTTMIAVWNADIPNS